MSEGVPSDIGTLEGALHGSVQIPPCHANSDVFPYLPSGGIEYNPEVFEQERLSTYTGLDDYDALFEARHGRGTVDNIPKTGEKTCVAPPMGMPSTITDQREHVSIGDIPSMTGPRVVSPINNRHILGEGAAIFTDMTETMLTALDQQMVLFGEAQ